MAKFLTLIAFIFPASVWAQPQQTVEWFEPKVIEEIGNEVLLSLKGRACFNCSFTANIPHFFYLPDQGAVQKVILKNAYKDIKVETDAEGLFRIIFRTPKVRVQIPVALTFPSGQKSHQALNFNSADIKLETQSIAAGSGDLKKSLVRQYPTEATLSGGPFLNQYKLDVESPKQYANFNLLNPVSANANYKWEVYDANFSMTQYRFSQAPELQNRSTDTMFMRANAGWRANENWGTYFNYYEIPVAYTYSATNIEVKKENTMQVGARYLGKTSIGRLNWEYYLGAMIPVGGTSVLPAQGFALEGGVSCFFLRMGGAQYGVLLHALSENYKIKYQSVTTRMDTTATLSNTFISGQLAIKWNLPDSK